EGFRPGNAGLHVRVALALGLAVAGVAAQLVTLVVAGLLEGLVVGTGTIESGLEAVLLRKTLRTRRQRGQREQRNCERAYRHGATSTPERFRAPMRPTDRRRREFRLTIGDSAMSGATTMRARSKG